MTEKIPARERNESRSDGHWATEMEFDHRSSVEVSRDAKGDYRWTVKVYFNQGDPEAQPIAQIGALDETLRAKFLIVYKGDPDALRA